jgi:hypothetical protein
MFLTSMQKDMGHVEFIALNITNKLGQLELRFVNKNHIQQVWQQNDDIIIELSDYTEIKVCNENIHKFMDRFV